jgi:hypothetical protein
MFPKWLAPVLPYFAVWAGLFFFQNAWAAMLGFHAAILLVLAAARPSLPPAALLRSKNPRRVLFSALFCSASGMGLFLLWDFFGVSPNLPSQLAALGLNASTWLWFIAYFSLVNPWVEEYFWRGMMGNDTITPHAGDVLYAGYHAMVFWGMTRPLTVVLAVALLASAGWFWRQISRVDGGLLSAVLGHMAADFSIMIVVYWMCK